MAVSDDQDWPEDPSERIKDVNEGELAFLPHEEVTDVHHHQNIITISTESLVDGWIMLQQCHDNLDAVKEAQITFHPDRIEALKVESYKNIKKAWTEDHSIQLLDVQPGASLCLSAKSLAFWIEDDGSYHLRNGPYMRRFLDGYYPLRLTLHVEFPDKCLVPVQVSPASQVGFNTSIGNGEIHIEALFEGKLNTDIEFRQTGDQCPDS